MKSGAVGKKQVMGKGKVGGVKNTGNDEEENSGSGREEKD